MSLCPVFGTVPLDSLFQCLPQSLEDNLNTSNLFISLANLPKSSAHLCLHRRVRHLSPSSLLRRWTYPSRSVDPKLARILTSVMIRQSRRYRPLRVLPCSIIKRNCELQSKASRPRASVCSCGRWTLLKSNLGWNPQ